MDTLEMLEDVAMEWCEDGEGDGWEESLREWVCGWRSRELEAKKPSRLEETTSGVAVVSVLG